MVNSNFFTITLLVLVVALSASIPGEKRHELRVAVTSTIAPVMHLFDRASLVSEKVDENLQTLENAQKEHARVLEENRKQETEKDSLLALAKENEDLRKKLGFRRAKAFHLLSCHMIGRDPSNWWNSIFVNRGSRDHFSLGKIEPGQELAVISPQGVVGKTGVVSRTATEVILIANENCRLSARLEKCREQGVIVGEGSVREGEPRTRMLFVPKEAAVELGERVFTSGLDGVFPAGLLVGKVCDTREALQGPYREIQVIPAFDPAQLSELFLIVESP